MPVAPAVRRPAALPRRPALRRTSCPVMGYGGDSTDHCRTPEWPSSHHLGPAFSRRSMLTMLYIEPVLRRRAIGMGAHRTSIWHGSPAAASPHVDEGGRRRGPGFLPRRLYHEPIDGAIPYPDTPLRGQTFALRPFRPDDFEHAAAFQDPSSDPGVQPLPSADATEVAEFFKASATSPARCCPSRDRLYRQRHLSR